MADNPATKRAIEIVEVSPRDGLQAESVLLPTESKVELISRALTAGLSRIEVCSFAHPDRVPAMADAEAVLDGIAELPHADTATFIALVLNRRGFDRAKAADVEEINVVVVATDTFADRNQGATSDETVDVFCDIAPLAIDAGIRPTVTISTSFGCPYEGEVDVHRVVAVAERCVANGATEVALADTIGVAVPTQVTRLFALVRDVAGEDVALRGHFHNTRNTGLANAVAAVDAGVAAVDASLGGIGGCPFAPNATGNIPTEDLVYLFERMGLHTGVDVDALLAAVPWIEDQLGKTVPGLLSKAGRFPAVTPR